MAIMADWNVCGGMWFCISCCCWGSDWGWGGGCWGREDGPATALGETGEEAAVVVAVAVLRGGGCEEEEEPPPTVMLAARRVLPREAASAAALRPRRVKGRLAGWVEELDPLREVRAESPLGRLEMGNPWVLPLRCEPLCGVGGGEVPSLFRSLRVIGGRECESSAASVHEH